MSTGPGLDQGKTTRMMTILGPGLDTTGARGAAPGSDTTAGDPGVDLGTGIDGGREGRQTGL